MSEFLLIHGSCHGAWCWTDLIPELRALGHGARAIDLPSHGVDATPEVDVTLGRYADAILAAMDGPTIVVGHSMAGYPITAAAAKDARNIRALVYLCAYVPRSGKSLADMRKMAPSQPLMEAVRVADDRVTFTVDPAQCVDKFYHDVPPDRAAWAVANLCPQPILPQETICPSAPTSIPRHYILCTKDRTIPPAFQRDMSVGCDSTRDMATSHSPFLSAPVALARHLHQIALAK